MAQVLRYAITDRTLYPGDASQQWEGLVQRCSLLAGRRIDFIQLRENDLSAAEITRLANSLRDTMPSDSPTRLLINSRPDVALASRAHGVHLTSALGRLTPDQVRRLYANAGLGQAVVSISCHTPVEVDAAAQTGANVILFGPVFGKTVHGAPVQPGVGLEALRQACELAAGIPVLALGGITTVNQEDCLLAGAAGIAGIRCFAADPV